MAKKGKTAYNENSLDTENDWINGINQEVKALCAGSVREEKSDIGVKVQLLLPDL